jgi:uncharacterized protein (TIGR03382 family)
LLQQQALKRITPLFLHQYQSLLIKEAAKNPYKSLKVPMVAALLQTRRALTSEEIQALESKGVVFRRPGGRLLSYKSFYPVRLLHERALVTLNTHPQTKRLALDPGLGSGVRKPLDHTARGIQVARLRKTLSDKKLPIRGKGVLIGLLDSGINVFHPHFFRADGGYFSWIDVDKDGKYSPCKDAVDLNSNGKADKGENLCCVQGRIYNSLKDPVDVDTIPGQCRAGIDWLYADKNDDKQRNYGPAQGFKETDPTFGEPLFVIDDVNGNRKLDPGEKLVALKTSKIKATLVKGVLRTRGKDLILTELSTNPRDSITHGTASASVMVGGQPGFHKFLGMAPDAEIVVASTHSYRKGAGYVTGTAEGLTWLYQQKALVVLHEYASWFGHYLDGSSAHEQLIDKMGADGYIQVTPTGNLGGSQKHMKVKIEPKSKYNTKIDVTLPPSYPSNYPNYSYMTLTLLWRDPNNKNLPANLQFFLSTPDGKRLRLSPTPSRGKKLWDGVFGEITRAVSSRGTAMLHCTFYGTVGENAWGPIPHQGKWVLEVENDDGKAATLHGYVSDNYSSWGVGIRWTENVNNDSLAGWPSTSDTSISVGAHVGHGLFPYNFTLKEKEGDLRGYSSGGPRIDGAKILWLTAPDNPVTAFSPQTRHGQPWVGFGQYRVFGGTSGASPHVAGAIALLKQLHPFWRQEKVKEVLRDSAKMDAGIPKNELPHKRWGYGKLRIYNALFGKEPPQNQPPKLSYKGPTTFVMGHLPKSLTMTVEDPEAPKESLVLQWDSNYTGQWSEPVATQKLPFPLDKPGKITLKVRVVDPKQESDDLLLTLEVKACAADGDCKKDFACKTGVCTPKPKPEPIPERPAKDALPDKSDVGCSCQKSSESAPLWMMWLFAGVLWWRRRRKCLK